MNFSFEVFEDAIVTSPTAWTPIGDGLEVLFPPDVEPGDSWEVCLQPFNTPIHLASAQVGEQLMVSSEYELLSLVHNNLVLSYNNTAATFNYPDRPSVPHQNHRTSNLVFFFNHLFLVSNRTIWWTDLDNLWNWNPVPGSEADFREIEWESSPVAALVRFNDLLFIHFPNTIYSLEYVGLPTIVRIQNRIQGAGAISPRVVQCTRTAMYFLSANNFYSWSIDRGLVPIGLEIWSKFVAQVTDWFGIWCYHDIKNTEICWVSGDTIWAFNYLEGHWQKYDSNQAQDHATIPWYGEDPVVVGQHLPIGLENIWVTPEGICREHREGDELSGILAYQSPYLETAAITYGDNHFHKKVDLVFIDSRYGHPWVGVSVYVKGLLYAADSDVTDWTLTGTFDRYKHRSLQQVDFPAVVGRALKFRFVLNSALDLPNGILDGRYLLDGRRLDQMDGRLGLDDMNQQLLGREYLNADRLVNEPVGRFELKSWGQRVDLPQTLIGPDK